MMRRFHIGSRVLSAVPTLMASTLREASTKGGAGKKPLSDHQRAALEDAGAEDGDVDELKDSWGKNKMKLTHVGMTEEAIEAYAVEKDYKYSFAAGLFAAAFLSLGCAFLFIPFYKMYCSPTGRGADLKFMVQKTEEQMEAERNKPQRKKLLKVRFICDIGNTMPINFVPLQQSLEVLIGEPSLAFYSAYNRSDRTLLGVSSYVIVPTEATPYLNKIQCFCFEEQRFKPRELVEMPVFFYIDRGFLADPMLNWLDEVLVNYTFFNLDRGIDLIKKM